MRCKVYENGRVAADPETLRLMAQFSDREIESGIGRVARSRSGRDTTYSGEGSSENAPLNQRMVSEARFSGRSFILIHHESSTPRVMACLTICGESGASADAATSLVDSDQSREDPGRATRQLSE